jgi:hypothetical protein
LVYERNDHTEIPVYRKFRHEKGSKQKRIEVQSIRNKPKVREIQRTKGEKKG